MTKKITVVMGMIMVLAPGLLGAAPTVVSAPKTGAVARGRCPARRGTGVHGAVCSASAGAVWYPNRRGTAATAPA